MSCLLMVMTNQIDAAVLSSRSYGHACKVCTHVTVISMNQGIRPDGSVLAVFNSCVESLDNTLQDHISLSYDRAAFRNQLRNLSVVDLGSSTEF